MKKKNPKLAVILSISLIVFSFNVILGQGSESEPKSIASEISDSTKRFPKWRAIMMGEDLIELDELHYVVTEQNGVILQLKGTIMMRDNTIATLERTITLQDTAYNKVLLRELKAEQISIHWQGEARKYKRQRNWTRAGVVVVVGGVVYKSVKNFLSKR